MFLYKFIDREDDKYSIWLAHERQYTSKIFDCMCEEAKQHAIDWLITTTASRYNPIKWGDFYYQFVEKIQQRFGFIWLIPHISLGWTGRDNIIQYEENKGYKMEDLEKQFLNKENLDKILAINEKYK